MGFSNTLTLSFLWKFSAHQSRSPGKCLPLFWWPSCKDFQLSEHPRKFQKQNLNLEAFFDNVRFFKPVSTKRQIWWNCCFYQIMERGRDVGISVAHGEVDGDHEVKLQTSPDVIQKSSVLKIRRLITINKLRFLEKVHLIRCT